MNQCEIGWPIGSEAGCNEASAGGSPQAVPPLPPLSPWPGHRKHTVCLSRSGGQKEQDGAASGPGERLGPGNTWRKPSPLAD